METQIEITAEDLRKGTPGHQARCPLARSFNRHNRKHRLKATATLYEITVYHQDSGAVTNTLKLSRELTEYVSNIDITEFEELPPAVVKLDPEKGVADFVEPPEYR